VTGGSDNTWQGSDVDLTHGTSLRVAFTKWGGRPHWSADGVLLLGVDEHGTWLGQWPGTHYERPGMAFETEGHQVMLLPRERGFAATFYEPAGALQYRLYVDITTVPLVFDGEVCAVDLDLDVLQSFEGELLVDDEDEFENHRVRYGYPPEVVASARAECDRVVEEVRSGAAIFSEAVAGQWRGVLRSLERR
jgi:hypothetical protein